MKKEFKLTERQRGFAADNHEVLMKFLENKKLPFDEFYDVVVFGYLYAVKLYDESEEQNDLCFELIANEHMQSELNSYYAKQREQNKNVRVLSLDYTVSFKDGLTAGDVIADSNVNVSDDVKENEGTEIKEQQSVEVKEESAKKLDSEVDLFEQVVAQAETKQAESVKNGLTDKLPIFSYANAKEEIVDTSKTFDKLREEKAEDFPELDDGGSVSWKMVYGTITKTVANPKKTTIASLKKEIENSKAFLDSLKKAKGEIECKVTPTVTAKKKGIAEYKGLCDTVEKAVSSGKVIAFVPSEDGKVYEVRNNRIGTFIAETDNISMLKKVKPGFIPALPKIPYRHLAEIIAFFKSYLRGRCGYEAMACIYWSVKNSEYYVYVPTQKVTPGDVDATIPNLPEDEFILVMEIHSHHVMPCSFSSTDNEDEKATRLYTVINRFDNVFPNILTRISVGGKFVDINPAEVFEGIDGEFPEKWRNAVEITQPLKGDVIK